MTIALDDKYALTDGRVFMTGVQALVRLLLDQRRADRAAGLRTAGFVSGYRGSPLGLFDSQMQAAARFLEAEDIVFQAGLNEDLAATAVWGSQQVGLGKGATVDGVFGLWYGKSPGVDRSGDVFKHANFAGTSVHGGVLAVAGDDPSCKSSSLPSQSDFAFVDAEMPLLAPSTLEELISFGRLGYALSRYAGCWVGMKTTADLMDSSATVDLQLTAPAVRLPSEDGEHWSGPRNIRIPSTPHEQEAVHRHRRLPAAIAFASLNRVDCLALSARAPRLLIVTSGPTYGLVQQALELLGLSLSDAAAVGISIYKVGLIWPLNGQALKAHASAVEEVLVIEEKRDLIEGQLRACLFDLPHERRPRVTGKRDPQGQRLVPDLLGLEAAQIARAIKKRADELGLAAALREVGERMTLATVHSRTPYFCSGCPHNLSTKVPTGSRALAGIGCHYLVQWMDRSTDGFTQMGGEGITWVGQAPFTSEQHVFANLGDGTYFHSGSLAIRQAVAAKVNITYKILYNDAVAMTGGQRHDGELTVPAIVAQLLAEGVSRVAVVQEEARTYKLPHVPGVTVDTRDRLAAVQEELRRLPGVTAVVFDQVCATEKRRRRKRGQLPAATQRAFINELVCEGCGDCTAKSNCVSIIPVETEFGRKRAVDQSSCNSDLSCVGGFCPSFVTVSGGRLRKPPVPSADRFEHLPAPELPGLKGDGWRLLLVGIGGQGVTSLSAIIGMAAHLEGREARLLDITGMAQKGGGVLSFVQIAPAGSSIHAPRIVDGGADVVLSSDMVGSASSAAMATYSRTATACVMTDELVPTAEFIRDPDVTFQTGLLKRRVADAVKTMETLGALKLAREELGDTLFANMILLGFAWQRGLVPLRWEALSQAIELNGAAVELNRSAFHLGRLMAHDPAEAASRPEPRVPQTIDELVDHRCGFLASYQDEAYAHRYRRLITDVRQAEASVAPGSTRLSEAVAKALFKLMAYKDEYEVARLYSTGSFREALNREFEGKFRLHVHLAPPLLARRDKSTGHPRKRAYGRWVLTAFALLARLKRLRGTPFDPFGWTAERRHERRLIETYENRVRQLIGLLSADNLDMAIAVAALPEEIRGFGHVKEAAIAKAEAKARELMRGVLEPRVGRVPGVPLEPPRASAVPLAEQELL